MTTLHFDGKGHRQEGLNENNQGVIVSTSYSKDIEGFGGVYNNSYYDNTAVAGAKYTPLQGVFGDGVKVKGGVVGGVAYTENGSYAERSPNLSYGNATLMGGLYAEVKDIPSGVGLNAVVVPPVTPTAPGFISAGFSKDF